MMETEKGKRIDQILATGVTREELAEALWCAESSVRMWNECADALRNENAKLRELCADIAREYECGYLTLPQCLTNRMRELRVEVFE